MARRRASLLDDLISLPWYIGLLIGVIVWVAAPSLADYIANASPLLGQARKSVIGIARLFAYLCAGAAAISLVRSFLLKRKFATQRSLADLRALTWQQFESIVGEAFRRRGYTSIETGQGGADGGVDLVLKKDGNRYLVQCKQYRSSSVSVMVVREIFGVVAAQRAAGAIVVTTGTFTKDAIDFARGLPIELIDGVKLESMVGDINRPDTSMSIDSASSMTGAGRSTASAAAAASSLSSSSSTETLVTTSASAPSCPRCSGEMVLRRPRAGGNGFYGCRAFPKCRGTRPTS